MISNKENNSLYNQETSQCWTDNSKICLQLCSKQHFVHNIFQNLVKQMVTVKGELSSHKSSGLRVDSWSRHKQKGGSHNLDNRHHI